MIDNLDHCLATVILNMNSKADVGEARHFGRGKSRLIIKR